MLCRHHRHHDENVDDHHDRLVRASLLQLFFFFFCLSALITIAKFNERMNDAILYVLPLSSMPHTRIWLGQVVGMWIRSPAKYILLLRDIY